MTIGNASFSASGQTQVVLDAYADFKELIGPDGALSPDPPSTKTARSRQPSSRTTPEPESTVTSEEVKAPTSLPLKPYLGRLKLPGNKEKATAVLAWSAESGGEAQLTIAEIEALMKKGGFKAPKNLSRDVRKAETEGWLDSTGTGPSAKFFINGYGEGIVAGWVQADKE